MADGIIKIDESNIHNWLDTYSWNLPLSLRTRQLLKVMEVHTLTDLLCFDVSDMERYSSTSKAIQEVVQLTALVHQVSYQQQE